MRAVGVDQLRHRLGHLPFVRHQVDPARVEGAWTLGAAAALVAVRPMVAGDVRVVTGFGSADDLSRLLDALAADVDPPARVMVDGPATALPDAWPLAEVHHWHWMRSTLLPPAVDGVVVEDVTDEAEVAAVLDAAAPDSHARPGTPGVEAWLGVRAEAGDLVAVGAVIRQPDGSGHLRAVTVLERARGRGLGRVLSTAMTRRAMTGPGVASLGVFVDNEPALRIYRGLGYEVAHSFVSGRVSVSASTTAEVPSR